MQIGEILAHAPSGSDEFLIPTAVLELLEEIRSDALDRGLAIGLHNKRGTTSRGVLDGGAQERELSRIYREQAEITRAWPRARRILQDLAEDYENEAHQEDQESERLHQGLDW